MGKTILIDMDGILVDFFPPFVKRYNELTQENISISDISYYSFSKSLKRPDVAYDIFESPGWFFKLEPMKESILYFDKLCQDGHDVIILTKPARNSDFSFADKRKWVRKYLPNYDVNNMMFSSNKHLVKGDVLFDDCPDHLINWKKNNPKGKTFKVLYQFNKDFEADYTLSKPSAWRTFYKIINTELKYER